MVVTAQVKSYVGEICSWKNAWLGAYNAGNTNGMTYAADQAKLVYAKLPASIAEALKAMNYTQAYAYYQSLTVETPAAPAPAPVADIIYKVGSSGDKVRYIQERLKLHGYNPGAIDGIFGDKTLTAVVAFQQGKGLSPDGKVGALTMAALDKAPAAAPAPAPEVTKPAILPVLRKGDKGDAVKYLQQLLVSYGFLVGNIDGDFGIKTDAAVRDYQVSRGLQIDGIVGANTWQALIDNAPAVEQQPIVDGEINLPNDGTELDWQYIVIHHTAAEEANTAQVKAYHLSLGWRDIGYNFVVERDGKIVVGRPLTMKGAHCKSDYYKKVGIAICGIGNFDNHEPTTAQWEGMRIITRKVQLEYNIPLVNIVGHGFIPGEATSCPGKYFDMAKFRSSLAGYTAEQVEQDLQNFNLKYNSVIETELDFEGALIDLDNVLIAGTGILAKF